MKKILFVESTLFKSGPNNQLGYIIDSLKEYSYKILILSNGDQLKGKNLFYLKIPQGIRGIFYLKYIKNFIDNSDYDLIHINSSFRVLLFLNFLIKDKSKLLFVLRNDPSKVWSDDHSFLIAYVLKKIYLHLIKQVNIVFCSRTLKKKYKFFVKKKSSIILNSINTNKISVRKKINQKKIKFLILSRLIDSKNIEFLINTFKENQFFDNHKLYIAGDGKLKKKFKNLSNKKKNIHILGHVRETKKLINNVDILLSASKTEGLPNSVLEAINQNTPCILSNIDQHKEIYAKNYVLQKLIFKNNDQKNLIKCIKYLLKKENLIKQNMMKLIKNYSVKSMVKKYEDFYSSIC